MLRALKKLGRESVLGIRDGDVAAFSLYDNVERGVAYLDPCWRPGGVSAQTDEKFHRNSIRDIGWEHLA